LTSGNAAHVSMVEILLMVNPRKRSRSRGNRWLGRARTSHMSVELGQCWEINRASRSAATRQRGHSHCVARTLRPPTRDRRPARRRSTQPVQPVARLPAPLPDHRQDLRPRQGIPDRSRSRCLTSSPIGCLQQRTVIGQQLAVHGRFDLPA